MHEPGVLKLREDDEKGIHGTHIIIIIIRVQSYTQSYARRFDYVRRV
jgi:hypothetical protein